MTVLTNLGEKMSDDEVDELLKSVDTSSGEINYTGMPSFYCISIETNKPDLVRTILAN
jgi:Ca2+-binding EF-hand superfamily protein